MQKRGNGGDMKNKNLFYWKNYSVSITIPLKQLNEPMLKTINWRYKDSEGKEHKIKITYPIYTINDLVLAKDCEMMESFQKEIFKK